MILGSGEGYLEITDKVTLAEVLKFYEYSNSWGVITIYNNSGEIIRKFDYDVHYDHDILCLVYNICVKNYSVIFINLLAVILCGSCAFDELRRKP